MRAAERGRLFLLGLGRCCSIRRAPEPLRRGIVLLVFVGGLLGTTRIVGAQQTGSADGTAPADLAGKANVVIFVNARSADSATLGIAYDRKVPHARVREDLTQLLKVTGWNTARDLQISDASVHPDHLDRFPATTAAMITVLQAPQVVQNAPTLLPYLQAFQAYDRVEVNFLLNEISPFLGVARQDNKAFAVELFHTAQGVYRYEAVLRDHHGTLPPLVAAPNASVPMGTGRTDAAQGHGNPWAIVLMVAGGGLIACACLYPLVLRRVPRRLTVRPATRR
jgi:hypothetical protein